MDSHGTFQQTVLVQKMQGFPNGTEIPDLMQIVEHCVTQNGGWKQTNNSAGVTEVRLMC
jgi:hypothetical protein